MIEVKGLTKRFGSKYALSDVSFNVAKGEILGFLGPNGAGKSTAMNIITGYLSSTEGTVKIGGHEILEAPLSAKAMLGYLPEHPPLYPDMTVKEYLCFVYALKKVKLDMREHITQCCEQARVDDVFHRRIKNLSKGYRQRVGLAGAMIGSPQVLVLDEPTAGLDPQQIIEMRGLIRSLGKERTILFSSHILSEVQAVCDRVLVLSSGVVVADGAPEKLSQSFGRSGKLIARIAGPKDRVGDLLAKLPGISGAECLGEKEKDAADWAIQAKEKADPRRELFAALSQKGWPLLGLKADEMSLEDVFLQLTQRAVDN
ncbi:MAG: ABC transporter ATP-binding protein [Oscillospiraceae bacterium]|nr:ABC transporter ATP-binding protein [Oscillospiraceae bacterium]